MHYEGGNEHPVLYSLQNIASVSIFQKKGSIVAHDVFSKVYSLSTITHFYIVVPAQGCLR